LDRLRARTPVPTESIEVEASAIDPADDVVLADTVGIALQVVLDRLTPAERVAFVLHDSFGVDFDSIASMLDTTPVAARKMASRARAKVRPATPEDALADWEIVDAFMAAARQGDFTRLLELLAPDVVVSADAATSVLGTPTRLEGPDEVAGFFNGAAAAAFPVFVEDRPGAAWVHRGEVRSFSTSPSRLDGCGVCSFAPRTTCSPRYADARARARGSDRWFRGPQATTGTVFRFRCKKSPIALQELLIALAPARISSVARLRLCGGGTNITLAMVTKPAPTAESTPGTESSMATAWVAPISKM
jgi:hypothetical protein